MSRSLNSFAGWMASLTLLSVLAAGCSRPIQPGSPEWRRKRYEWDQKARAVFTPERIEAEAKLTEAALPTLYALITAYQGHHGGRYPESLEALRAAVFKNPSDYPAAWSDLKTSGMAHLDDPKFAERPWESQRFLISHSRPDGSRIGGPKKPGKRDVIAGRVFPPVVFGDSWTAFAVVLWDDGEVTREPYSRWVMVPVPGEPNRSRLGFKGQAGVPERAKPGG